MTDPVDQSLFLRVIQADLDRINALVEDIPVVTRASLAREAMRIGLEALERDRMTGRCCSAASCPSAAAPGSEQRTKRNRRRLRMVV